MPDPPLSPALIDRGAQCGDGVLRSTPLTEPALHAEMRDVFCGAAPIRRVTGSVIVVIALSASRQSWPAEGDGHDVRWEQLSRDCLARLPPPSPP